MGSSNFSEEALAGEWDSCAREVSLIKKRYEFDFVSVGLTAFVGAPLKWVYSAGATGERFRRIALSPGHGIGGIAIKSGKPMMFTDIDEEIDPREYSSYPIVFAEDLRSFCALPLTKRGRVVAVLLCAFRSTNDRHEEIFRRLIEDLDGRLLDLAVVADEFMDFDRIASSAQTDSPRSPIAVKSDLSRVIAAQEDERKRISRDLHDGIAQELLSISFLFNKLSAHVDNAGVSIVTEARDNIDRILDELHNISVELRPSVLDHLGFASALRSQVTVLEKTYGAKIVLEDSLSQQRFDQALETQAYRICQEAILNACKYSDTDKIFVALEDSGGWLNVSVVDQGRGFDVEGSQGRGCGLRSMQERACLIGAALSVESGEGGTAVTLVAPMNIVESKEMRS